MSDTGMEGPSTMQVTPYRKQQELKLFEGKSEADRTYPHRQLHIGALLHFYIQNAVRHEPDKPAMSGFIDFMNTQLSEGSAPYGDRIADVGKSVAQKVAKKLDRTVEPGWEISWAAEVPFEPSVPQVEIIEKSVKDTLVVRHIEDLGFRSVDQFAIHAITDPDFHIPDPADPDHAKISLDKIITYCQNHPEDPSENMHAKLARFTAAIASYHFFRFDTASVVDPTFHVEDIPEKCRRLIASASARADLLGFSWKEGDSEAQKTAETFMQQLSGTTFGSRALLDLTLVTPEILANYGSLMDLLRHDRIRLSVAEIKTHVVGRNNEKVSGIQHPVPNVHIEDMGHTMLAQFQFLARMEQLYQATQGKQTNGIDTKSLLRFMRSSEKDWWTNAQDVIEFTTPFLGGNEHYQLIRVLWPLIDVRKINTFPFHGMPTSNERFPEPQIDVSEVDHRKLRGAAARASRKFLDIFRPPVGDNQPDQPR